MHLRTLTLLAVLAGAAVTPTASSADEITNPDWLKKPTASNLLSLYPTKALREGTNGKALITCVITVQGTLRQCRVLSESPEGAGFGAAAIALTPQFLMRPALKDGVRVEATVTIPINFKTDGPVDPELGSHIANKPPKSALVYSNLPFSEAPTFGEVLAAYPPKAKESKASGVASLKCAIRAGGKLDSCVTVREEPKGLGFASAAKALAASFTTPVDLPNGDTLVGSRSMLLVAFDAAALGGAVPVIGRPKWVGIPNVRDLSAVMPPKAREAKVYKARVQMSCKVAAGGTVEGCAVETEDPLGMGWGEAAVKLSPYFRLSVWTDEGLPTVGGSVRIPLRFDLPPPEPAPAAKP